MVTLAGLAVSFCALTRWKVLFWVLKFTCYSLPEHLNSLRGQFWGRAALAPVIRQGPGAPNFPDYSRKHLNTKQIILNMGETRAPSSRPVEGMGPGRVLTVEERLATFVPSAASYESPVTDTLGVCGCRKEDHGSLGSF